MTLQEARVALRIATRSGDLTQIREAARVLDEELCTFHTSLREKTIALRKDAWDWDQQNADSRYGLSKGVQVLEGYLEKLFGERLSNRIV